MTKQSPWVFVYDFQTYMIPEYMREGIELYINLGVRPGEFLKSVISNDLKESVMYADGENMMNLPAYVNYFYNHAPHDCYGSAEIMEKWIKKMQSEKRGW